MNRFLNPKGTSVAIGHSRPSAMLGTALATPGVSGPRSRPAGTLNRSYDGWAARQVGDRAGELGLPGRRASLVLKYYPVNTENDLEGGFAAV